MNNIIFAKRLRELREQIDLTQEQVGESLTTKKIGPTISLWEKPGSNRKPNYQDLIDLAKLFNCTVDYLIGNSDIKNFDPQPGGVTKSDVELLWPDDKMILRRAGKVLTTKEKERILKIIDLHIDECEKGD